MAQRRAFGTVRKLPSGRFQARYTHPETGVLVSAASTFANKGDATRFLSQAETDLVRGESIDVSSSKQLFGSYGSEWLDSRTDLRPKTMDLYRYLFNSYLDPVLGKKEVGKIDARAIRQWHGILHEGTQSDVTSAKGYRLLRQILQAAVDDRMLRSNPCTLKGAAVERSAERSIPTLEQVLTLSEVIKPEYRLMVLLAGLVGLRRGECFGLRVDDLEPGADHWSVAVDASIVFVRDKAYHQAPKTAAGVRRLALPSAVTTVAEQHLANFGRNKPSDLLFVDLRTGTTPTMTVWRRVWANARRDASVECTFHDLRHHAGTLTATAGASIRESMARLGHSSPRAALRYQHVAETRDAEVASAMDRLIQR
ncbi:tyrosine-type recombinase/integrase [Ilumatobacter sp.]|uniref:tyrosine-type recombinase/integrase n=1 Tax=Ilumatobacter sp. TaxID=1967498 RepID=UPI003751FD66